MGVAPGFFFEEGGKFIAALPGVPEEMRAMFLEELKPVLAERVGGRVFLRRRILRTCGMSESAVNQALQDILKKDRPAVGLTAKETGVDVRIVGEESSSERAQAEVEKAATAIRERLGDAIYGVDNQDMEEVVGALLKQRRLKLSVAESCTGGPIGARITNVSGSSEYFERGAVVYGNQAKTEILGVPEELIKKHGSVSREVAAAMAQGIRRAARTDYGLSVTGIAGPGGGTRKSPWGLCISGLQVRRASRSKSTSISAPGHRYGSRLLRWPSIW